MVSIKIPLKVINREFIRILKFAEVVCGRLHRVISQMNKAILEILQIKGLWTCAKVNISVHPPLQAAINRSEHRESSNVKFPALDQQRLVQIFLDNGGAVAIGLSVSINQSLDLTEVIRHFDSAAPVTILAWFDDPDIWATFLLVPVEMRCEVFELRVGLDGLNVES